MRDFFEKNACFGSGVPGPGVARCRFLRGFRRFRKAEPAPLAVPAGPAGRRAARFSPEFLALALLGATSGLPARAGETIRLPVTADTWISAAPGETEGSNGAERRLKLKSHQELTLLDVDPAPLRGRVIERVTLHVVTCGERPLLRATLSSVGAPWSEGGGRSYDREPGAASFRWAATGRRPWDEEGGDVTDAILGAGSTRWCSSPASAPDADGRQSLGIDPLVLATRAAGLGFGFALIDDIGSEYTREGERIRYHPFPNRFVHSRESGAATAPWFEVELGAADREPPPAVSDLRLCDGGRALSWTVPFDRSPAKTVGGLVRFQLGEALVWEGAREVPAVRVEHAGTVGAAATARIDGLGIPVDEPVTFAVRAVDAAGNLGEERRLTGRLPARPAAPALDAIAAPASAPARRLGELEVAFQDARAVLDPVPGAPLVSQDSVLAESAARGEWIDFQVALRGPPGRVRASIAFDEPPAGAALRPTLWLGASVATADGRAFDPLEPCAGELELSGASGATRLLFVEVWVPREARVGAHTGRLALERGEERLEVPLAIDVIDWTLPARLAFVPEMNAYDLAQPPDERAWYALAHEHRVNLNVLRYDWGGRVQQGCAPEVVDGGFEWTAFDARFGPLLDGTAFADGTRPGVPVENFYLPLNENWPVPVEPSFCGGYWADAALDHAYWREFATAARGMAAHVKQRGWSATTFQFCLNDKIIYKRGSWSACAALWNLDEPLHAQDFFALSWYGRAFRAGVGPVGVANVLFRVDLSRPQWARDWLDGRAGVRVVGAAMAVHGERVRRTKERCREDLYLYATANAPGTPNTMPVAWCIDAWCQGADGVIPWQSIGRAASWERADPLALLYPPRDGRAGPPCPSLRLKAFRRGQQDVELLEAWRARLQVDREAVAARVREIVDLASNARQRFEEDAGELAYPRATAEALAALRRAMRAQLAAPR